LSGVPNVEDLGQPEPLTPAVEQEAEALVSCFGDYITRCIYSKTWNLRDAAIQKLTLGLRDGVYNNKDPSRLLEAFSTILKRTLADKNVQVCLSSFALLQTMSDRILSRGRAASPQASLEPLMPLLLERLGDSNTRVDKAARDAHIDLARCPNVGAAFTAQYLLRPPKKKTMHARVYSSRLQLLTAIVQELGVQPDRRDGLPLDPTMQLAMDWFSNPTAEVRENVVKLVAACHAHVGLERIGKYLANLRQSQREVFDAEFEKTDDQSRGGPTPQRHVAGNSANAGRPQDGSGSRGTAPRTPAPAMEVGAAEDEDFDDFTCQFCGRRDDSFTSEALDVHYWRECPMLTQCEYCQQVIEISTLRSHLCDECENVDAARSAVQSMPPGHCPLCRVALPGLDDQDWIDHLLKIGCRGNPRANHM
jgi:centrosomal protein CEP104